MELELEQKVTHKTLGEGYITDIYEEDNGSTYVDVHFVSEDDSYHGKYKVRTFRKDTFSDWFE